jgi:hypothetical protein
MRKPLALASAVIIFSFASPINAQPQAPAGDTVIIENSGSTNVSGYQIVIESSGQVTVTPFGRINPLGNRAYANGRYHVPLEMVKNLVDDLNSALPFPGTAAVCAKSVSFGTQTHVTFKGQASPDIECMGNREKYVHDIFEIERNIPRNRPL